MRVTALTPSAGFRKPIWLSRLLLVLLAGCRPPDDAELAQRFMRDSSEYGRLVQMLNQDSSIGAIAPGFLWHADEPFKDATPAGVGITEQRLADYRRTMKRLGVARIDRWAEGRLMFGNWGSGFAGNTHHRGIAWMRIPIDSTRYRVFREIRAPWYLFED